MRKEILLYGERQAMGEIGQMLDDRKLLYDCTAQPDIGTEAVCRWIGAFQRMMPIIC